MYERELVFGEFVERHELFRTLLPGLLEEGQVIVLMTKGTRNEFYYYAANNRESRMKKILGGMQRAKKKKRGFISADRLEPGLEGADAGGTRGKEDGDGDEKTPEAARAPEKSQKKWQTKMSDFD